MRFAYRIVLQRDETYAVEIRDSRGCVREMKGFVSRSEAAKWIKKLKGATSATSRIWRSSLLLRRY
jgi:hypothetical protein